MTTMFFLLLLSSQRICIRAVLSISPQTRLWLTLTSTKQVNIKNTWHYSKHTARDTSPQSFTPLHNGKESNPQNIFPVQPTESTVLVSARFCFIYQTETAVTRQACSPSNHPLYPAPLSFPLVQPM